ncbi:chemotaxis protein CheW [Chitinispirillales bacterium ANBcel5]|uniref:chemotaxis protein CheW n=1 Tax=Cellulosispirillum alkaliphilum TaxID=3039283 RepID=UPI002A540E6A|nr:chemotaxis protein CheW [Chitinispirillales bacterium ANBcel5]
MKYSENEHQKEQAILKARAEELARKTPKTGKDKDCEIVSFRLLSKAYAFEAMYVEGIIHIENYAPLPFTPSFILGIISVRGKIISLVSIRELLGLTGKSNIQEGSVIILKSETMKFGVIADSVLGFEKIKYNDVCSVPEGFKKSEESYMKAITKDQVVLLDAKRMLSDKRMIVGKR